MFVYFIIGIILCAYGIIKGIRRGEWTAESWAHERIRWCSAIIFVIGWPIIMAWVLYDTITE